jgi:predicted SprT family Zn-dependent metalloprotease
MFGWGFPWIARSPFSSGCSYVWEDENNGEEVMNLQRAQMMAEDLMRHYHLAGWAFRFDRSLMRLGYCESDIKRISLGRYATEVNSEEQVLMTIVHEIAHALVGGRHGHDEIWRAKAIELGHSGKRCGTIAVKPTPKAVVLCHSCNSTWNLYRVTKRYTNNLSRMWCKTCGREKSFGRLAFERVK